jgi:hypothetical protein
VKEACTLEACVPRRLSLFQGVAHDMNDSSRNSFQFSVFSCRSRLSN